MLKKLSISLLVLVFVLSFSFSTYAENNNSGEIVNFPIITDFNEAPKVNLSIDDTEYPVVEDEPMDSSKPAPRFGPTNITYKIVSKTHYGSGYKDYRTGPSGRGPATLSINSSKTINRSFTNTISGDYPIGKGKIAQSLSTTIGDAKTYGTSYSIPVEKGKTKLIIYRPFYYQYKVKQRQYVNGMATNTYKYAYVIVFQDWDYDWKYL
ncbi:hypothetical protein GW626_02950 [Peribacillus muralis]|uniref:hypothetical protein n=1 Tax=Peribacillus muralis TaxID=264697 RepID=UPI001F4E080D|nr:hypothetical protein [Peribacillus muralis]MCK1993966.1 hypothetical protein [Peribacillus muralis]MCK2014521.1 hypothetical protein [Peribacillus muralis]